MCDLWPSRIVTVIVTGV